MTKEEFLTIVDREIERLSKEKATVQKKIKYFSVVDPKSEELKKDNYKLSLIDQQINALNGIVLYPLYVRIQSMTNEEIEKYRELLIKKVELEIEKANSEKDILNKEIDELNKEQEKIIENIDNYNEEELEQALNRGKEIVARINELKEKSQEENNKKLEELREKKKDIKEKSSTQIKEELSKKIETHINMNIVNSSLTLSELGKSIQVIANDPNKIYEIISAMEAYRNINSRLYTSKEIENIDLKGLPIPHFLGGIKSLEDSLDDFEKEYKSTKLELKLINNLKNSFKHFSEHYLELPFPHSYPLREFFERPVDNLMIYYNEENAETLAKFIKSIEGIIDINKLKELEVIARQYSDKKNSWGGKLSDFELEKLKEKAEELYSIIVEGFLRWYNDKLATISARYHLRAPHIYNLSDFRFEMENFNRSFDSIASKISSVRSQIEPKVEEIDADYKAINERIGSLSEGTELSTEKFKSIASTANTDKKMLSAAVNAHTNTVMNKVVEEAKQQPQFEAVDFDELIRQRSEIEKQREEEVKTL